MNAASDISPLHQLASLYGVQTAYHDVAGRLREASTEALIAVLRALGAPVVTLPDVPAAIRERRQALWQQWLDPVVVAWDAAPPTLQVRLPSRMANLHLVGRLILESGEPQNWEWDGADLPVLEAEDIEGTSYVVRSLSLPPGLPCGYHRFVLEGSGQSAEALIIVAPTRAYSPPEESSIIPGHPHPSPLPSRERAKSSLPTWEAVRGRGIESPNTLSPKGSDDRTWGVFLPLYALHRQHGWQSGNFSDLEALASWIGGKGGGVVATLPLLASFPDQASPYVPVSRLLWNELYVDLAAVPELAKCATAQALMASASFQEEMKVLRAMPLVDYRRQMALKRQVMEELYRCCFDDASERFNALNHFVETHPVVEDYAQFRAAGERQRLPWCSWPKSLQDGVLTEGDYDEGTKRYHLYVQWLAHQQVQALSEKARQQGVRLYLDLPLGVHPDGYDVWRQRSIFAADVSGGAPPDSFFTKGQDWGFPPLHPERLRQQGYSYYIACLQHHLRHAGILRVDHVMGLHRLFWVPRGMEATEGVYVRYREEEFYAILSLESHRHNCWIVGENLGTVPPYVNQALRQHNIRQMHVVQYALTADPYSPLGDITADCVSSLNTHDMPTFAGFWQGLDINDRVAMGLLDKDGAQQETERHERLKETLIAFLQQKGLIAGSSAGLVDILQAILKLLSASPAQAVLVNLEDLWLESQPQNVPGTQEEFPNWRHRARYTFEEFCLLPQVADLLDELGRIRSGWKDEGKTPRILKEDKSDECRKLVEPMRYDVSLLTEQDTYLFNEGSHFRLYEKMGSHLMTADGVEGTYFAVWAPDAQRVSVVGEFNGWDQASHLLRSLDRSGIWEGFAPGVIRGSLYKYHIVSRYNAYEVDKADPFAFYSEVPPRTASVVWDTGYAWEDQEWMLHRGKGNSLSAPIAIYEMHLGSWMRLSEEGNRSLSYREIAPRLAEYVRSMGFTHVELLPVMEHPFYGSWGYQTTGYFAPTSRYGRPQDLMYLIDHLHQNGIGVILDWVPSHFPSDEHSLGFFDGTHLYEHGDPREGFHPDWKSFIFNYGRNEVNSFLISSALFWLDKYHADGLRVDAVASMLYRDYSRKEGEWIPNQYGGRENLEALAFLRRCNQEVYRHYPDVQTIAEESTAWPMVSRPTYVGGLGFGLKWDMGWMHDTLKYMTKEPIFRKYHHNELTFRLIYAFHENFVLPLSHDEVVHGKGSLLGKMPGDPWQKFANLRLLLGYMYAQPGKKLLFMGGEFGQWREWTHDESLEWQLLQYPAHAELHKWVQDLNRLYRSEAALHELDSDPAGFEWIDCNDTEHSVISLVRKGRDVGDIILAVCNFTPVAHRHYRVGVPRPGFWREILNSDAREYGGGGHGNLGGTAAALIPHHGRPYSLSLTLPPLAVVFFKG